ncbi:hypothetical protein IFR05_012438 [Cadophora sp. M221]|nr:hypothetical protein IFR05_012438 [Cadophora sp. M221]
MSDPSKKSLFALSETSDEATHQNQRAQNSDTLDRYIYDTDNLLDFLVNGKTTPEAERIAKALNVGKHRKTHELEYWYLFAHPLVLPSQSVNGKQRHDWKGPMVILSQPGTLADSHVFKDVNATIFRVAVDYFKNYGPQLGHDTSGTTLISGTNVMQHLSGGEFRISFKVLKLEAEEMSSSMDEVHR